MRRRVLGPGGALAVVAGVWVALSLSVALLTPPWEANDEPDHVRNVQVLAAGNWYRIADGAGFEAHQPPLYYLVLAGWQQALGIPPRAIAPPLRDPAEGTARGIFRHDVPSDGADGRLVAALRLPGVALGLLTLLLTAAAARRLSDDPWTPAVAAAWMGGVPKFTFLSGVVNNDNLTTTVAAGATVLAVIALRREGGRPRWVVAGGLGALLGALVLSKLSAAPLGAVMLTAALLGAGPAARERVRATAVFGASALVVCGWWLVQNQSRYGDPLASRATHDHLERLFPPIFDTKSFAEQAFSFVPDIVYSSFWYSSGYNQFDWQGWVYLPLWLGLAAAIAGLATRRHALAAPRHGLPVLAGFVFAAFAALWIVGLETTTVQGRLAFTGLPALACMAALGLERRRLPVLARFVFPALTAAATFVAVRRDVIDIYF